MSGGWTPITEALPPVGERVDVMHQLNRSYDCTGELDENGEWGCSNAFILPTNPPMLVWSPTHWRPLSLPVAGAA